MWDILELVDRPVYKQFSTPTKAPIMEVRPPLPPFSRETAILKVRLAEDGWNTRDASKVAMAYTVDTKWRNRIDFIASRAEAQAFLF